MVAMARSDSEPSLSPDPYVHKIPMPHPQQRSSALKLARAVMDGRLSRHADQRATAERFDAYDDSDYDDDEVVAQLLAGHEHPDDASGSQARSMARMHAQSLSRISSSAEAEAHLIQRPATAAADCKFSEDERWAGSSAHGRCVLSTLSAASSKRLSNSGLLYGRRTRALLVRCLPYCH